jgi:hypothetical protein
MFRQCFVFDNDTAQQSRDMHARRPLSWCPQRLIYFFPQKVFLALAVGILAAQIGRNYDARDESGNTAIRDMGVALLQGLPQVSTVTCPKIAFVQTRSRLETSFACFFGFCFCFLGFLFSLYVRPSLLSKYCTSMILLSVNR